MKKNLNAFPEEKWGRPVGENNLCGIVAFVKVVSGCHHGFIRVSMKKWNVFVASEKRGETTVLRYPLTNRLKKRKE